VRQADGTGAARAAADRALQDALGELIIVVRERLHPAPPLRWWIRAGSQLVPRGRRRSETVPAQRAGGDTAAVTAGEAALPAAPTP
jgi:hypothetical protein